MIGENELQKCDGDCMEKKRRTRSECRISKGRDPLQTFDFESTRNNIFQPR